MRTHHTPPDDAESFALPPFALISELRGRFMPCTLIVAEGRKDIPAEDKRSEAAAVAVEIHARDLDDVSVGVYDYCADIAGQLEAIATSFEKERAKAPGCNPFGDTLRWLRQIVHDITPANAFEYHTKGIRPLIGMHADDEKEAA